MCLSLFHFLGSWYSFPSFPFHVLFVLFSVFFSFPSPSFLCSIVVVLNVSGGCFFLASLGSVPRVFFLPCLSRALFSFPSRLLLRFFGISCSARGLKEALKVYFPVFILLVCYLFFLSAFLLFIFSFSFVFLPFLCFVSSLFFCFVFSCLPSCFPSSSFLCYIK